MQNKKGYVLELEQGNKTWQTRREQKRGVIEHGRHEESKREQTRREQKRGVIERRRDRDERTDRVSEILDIMLHQFVSSSTLLSYSPMTHF